MTHKRMKGKGLIEPPDRTPKNDLGEWLREFYATTKALPEDFLAEREDTLPQERDCAATGPE